MATARLFPRNEIDAQQWDSFVESSPQQSIYCAAWYLDCVCAGWSAVIVEEEGVWQAVLPLNIAQKMGQQYSLSPYFTQHLGLLTRPEEKPQGRVFGTLKSLEEQAIKGIPEAIKLFQHNFHPSLQYLLPFHWEGFALSPRYTYWLDLSGGLEKVRKNFTKSVTSDLKRAEREQIAVRESEDIAQLSRLLRAKDLIGEKEETTLQRLWQAVRERKAGKVLHALSPSGELLCAAAFLFDKGKMIYLLSAASDLPRQGANTLLIDHAMGMCPALQLSVFDFEGSMLKPVEEYFRAFNPEMKIYFQVSRDRMPAMVKWGYEAKRRWSGK
jgi:hypothetical protein